MMAKWNKKKSFAANNTQELWDLVRKNTLETDQMVERLRQYAGYYTLAIERGVLDEDYEWTRQCYNMVKDLSTLVRDIEAEKSRLNDAGMVGEGVAQLNLYVGVPSDEKDPD